MEDGFDSAIGGRGGKGAVEDETLFGTEDGEGESVEGTLGKGGSAAVFIAGALADDFGWDGGGSGAIVGAEGVITGATSGLSGAEGGGKEGSDLGGEGGAAPPSG